MSGNLGEFTPKQIVYIQARATEDTNAAAYRRAGYTRNQWYHMPQELRDRLNDEAFKLASDGRDRAAEIYVAAMADAARDMVEISKTAKKDSDKIKALLDILERGGFRSKTQIDVTSADQPIGIQTIEVVLDRGEDEESELLD